MPVVPDKFQQSQSRSSCLFVQVNQGDLGKIFATQKYILRVRRFQLVQKSLLLQHMHEQWEMHWEEKGCEPFGISYIS